MKYTITSDGGKIRRGDQLESMLLEFDPRENKPDGGAVTVFEGDSTNVLFYGSPRKAARYIANHPEHRRIR
jgi:hypothetical protein